MDFDYVKLYLDKFLNFSYFKQLNLIHGTLDYRNIFLSPPLSTDPSTVSMSTVADGRTHFESGTVSWIVHASDSAVRLV